MQVTFTINELKDAIDKAATELFDEQRNSGGQSGLEIQLELVLSKETDQFPLVFRFKLPD